MRIKQSLRVLELINMYAIILVRANYKLDDGIAKLTITTTNGDRNYKVNKEGELV